MKKYYPVKKKNEKDTYDVCSHPFQTFLPDEAKVLIIGTFPTQKANRQFEFYYGSRNNYFWTIISACYPEGLFKHSNGKLAKFERENLCRVKGIAFTDMLKKCYRKNGGSTDDALIPIVFTDIFAILRYAPGIKTLILTSRTDVHGTLWYFRTYFLQQDCQFPEVERDADDILFTSFEFEGRLIELYVPISPSSSVSELKYSLEKRTEMYKKLLKINSILTPVPKHK